jgi:hypothetical protein
MTIIRLDTPRYSILPSPGGDILRIPAPRLLFGMAFMSVWLAGWTVVGVASITEFLASHAPFLLFWLCAWALGWAYAALTLVWMFFGSETLRVIDGDLSITHTVLGISRRWLYRGSAIQGLSQVPTPSMPPGRRLAPLPFGFGGQQGSVQFSYGGRSRLIAQGMDMTEASQIIAWLKQRLPEAQRP